MSENHELDVTAAEPIADPGLPAHTPRPTDVDPAAERRAERQVATMFGLSVVFAVLFCVAYFTFSIGHEGDGLRFRIESHARSKDMLVHLMYHTLGIGKYKQGETWTHFCNVVADVAGGESDGVQVTTYRCENDGMYACTFEELADPAAEERLERTKLRDRQLRERGVDGT